MDYLIDLCLFITCLEKQFTNQNLRSLVTLVRLPTLLLIKFSMKYTYTLISNANNILTKTRRGQHRLHALNISISE